MKKLVLALTLLGSPLFAQDLQFFKLDFIKKTNNKLSTLSEAEKKEPAILLDSKIYVEYYKDSLTQNVEQYYGLMRRFHIHEAGAVDSYNKVYLPISASSELIDIKVRSINPKGIVKELGQSAIKETTEEGQTYKMVAVEGLEPGSEMEFFYVIKTPINIYSTEPLLKKLPIRNWDFLIVSPDFLKFEAKLYNAVGIKKDTVINKKAFVSYNLKDITPVFDEKYSSENANTPRIEYKLTYNTAKDNNKLFTWKDAGNQFFEMMHASSKNTLKEIEKVLKKEKILEMPEDQAIRAIENYVKSNINIKEDAEDAMPEAILKSKYAEAGGLARLYVQMFEAANVNYELVIGISRFKKKFDKAFETWTQLDKYFFYFPNAKKYLDPSNPMLRLGQIESGLEGTDALFIANISIGETKSGISKIKTIPFSTAAVNYNNIDAEVSFPANLAQANIKLTRTLGGSQDGEIKGYLMLSNDTQRKEILDNILKASLKEDAEYSNIVAKNYDINSDEVNKPFILSSDVVAKNMIEKAGKKYIFKLGDILGPQQELYNERPRQQSIDVGSAHEYVRNITITIPEGYKVRGLEEVKRNITYDFEGKKNMGFVSDYQVSGNKITITINEYYHKVLLPLSVYDDFQKVINAAADFNKVTIIFEN